MLWTQWSSFKDLTLKSQGNTIVSIPYKYKDTMMYSLGGDYRFTDQLTLRAGVAFDETPTRDSTRDPRIPDNDRWFTSLGFGYDIKAIPGLTIDGAYSAIRQGGQAQDRQPGPPRRFSPGRQGRCQG